MFVATLAEVAARDFAREGFGSEKEFVKKWKEIHGSFNQKERVCCLRFELVAPSAPFR